MPKLLEEPYQNTLGKDGWVAPEGQDWEGWKESFPRDWIDSFEPHDRQFVGRKYELETGESERLVTAQGVYKPPDYYAELSPISLYAKAIGIPIVALLSYSTILDGLSYVQPNQFVPCNEECHYMRIFSSEHIPGSGPDIMRIENGISRPVALRSFEHVAFTPYPCPRESHNHTHHRTFVDKLYTDRKACSSYQKSLIPQLLEDDPDLAAVVAKEMKAAEENSMISKLSFWANKIPLTLFIYLFSMGAKSSDQWGMEHIINPLCPNMTKAEMKTTCEKKEVKNNIVNHLGKTGPSKIALCTGLLLWAAFKIVHDCMLLSGVKEIYTLTVSYASTASLGVATAALFFWSMGAMGVFAAPVPGYEDHDCLCYYVVPKVIALGAISSPFGLLALFAAAVQMLGLACLYGDFLYFLRYDVPYYLTKQSYLSTWGILVTPKVAGTYTAEKRKKFSEAEWKWLYGMHWTMCTFRVVVVYGFAAFAAAPFIMGTVELIQAIIYNHYYEGNDDFGNVIPFALSFVLYSFSIIAPLAGIKLLMDIYYTCIRQEKGEYFADQMNLIIPDCIFGEKEKEAWKGTTKETVLAYIVGIIGTIFVVVATMTVMWGLFPSAKMTFAWKTKLSKAEAHKNLAECELLSACGFTFVGLHLMQGVAYVFSSWDDLESLKNIAQGDPDKAQE